ncbi:MAG: FtsX-like permease family protein [Aquificaceae bacterium]|nr:FtsX-like permease family protein [Aquificaceae bacterium]MDW8237425.1 FtsX-like permease family protein [Aquificaceae bacterium]
MVLKLALAMMLSRGLSRIIAFLGIFGVCIGICGVILTLGVFRGFQNELKRNILSSSPHIVISFVGEEKKVRNPPEFEKVLRIESYQGFIAYSGRVMSVSLRAMEDRDIIKHFGMSLEKGVLIGEGLMGVLGAKVGDEVMIIDAFSYPPRVKRALIEGSFKRGSIEQDYASVVLKPALAREVFNQPLIGYEIYLKDPFRADRLKKELEESLGNVAIIRSWMDLNRGLFEALELERRIAAIVVFIVVIVGSFSIVSLILTKIREKARDFIVLSLFGMSKIEIFLVVFIQGILVSAVGGLLGLILGLSLAEVITDYKLIKIPKEVYMIESVPIEVGFFDAIISFLGAMFVGAIASFLSGINVLYLKASKVLKDG